MRYLARFSPIRAIRDLRVFLSYRQPHELWFLMLAIVITGLILIGLFKDSYAVPEYRPNIVYVKQWRLDRTAAEIAAQQKIDQPIKEKLLAEQKAEQAKKQAEFKALDDRLTRLGL